MHVQICSRNNNNIRVYFQSCSRNTDQLSKYFLVSYRVIVLVLVLVRYQVLFDTDRYLNLFRYSILTLYVLYSHRTQFTVEAQYATEVVLVRYQNSSISIDILLVRYQNCFISINNRFLFDTRNLPCKSNSLQISKETH